MIGNLTIYSADPDAFGEQEVELLGELADDLGFGIGMLRLRAENKRGVAALEHAAYHDALTDLPNRARLSRHLEGAIGDAEKHGRSVALLDVDINRFREINEALGYREGDALLQLVGARLRELAADPDTVARLGGDEFAVVLNSADAGAAIRFSREVLAALARPFNLSDFSLDRKSVV